MSWRQEFGKRLKKTRIDNGFSRQESFAKAVGISVQAVSMYEIGERSPTAETVAKMASVLHCTADYLLLIEDAPTHESSDIAVETGLSPEAVDRLKSSSDGEIAFLSEILTSRHTIVIAASYYDWKNSVKNVLAEDWLDNSNEALASQVLCLERKDLMRYYLVRNIEYALDDLEKRYCGGNNGQHHEV